MDWLSPIKEIFDSVFPLLERFYVLRIILGLALVFFLPGFAWSLVFFSELGIIERVVLSLALSVVVVTISLLFSNRLLGIEITGFNSVLTISTVTALPLAGYYGSRFLRRSKDSAA